MVFTRFTQYVVRKSCVNPLSWRFSYYAIMGGSTRESKRRRRRVLFFPSVPLPGEKEKAEKMFESPAAALFCQIKQPLKMCG